MSEAGGPTAFGSGCEHCGGTGAVPEHDAGCDTEFCVLNGDEYSCSGIWVPCPGCSPEPEPAA